MRCQKNIRGQCQGWSEQHGAKLIMSPCDKTALKPSGGVASISARGVRCSTLQHKHAGLNRHMEKGRIALYVLDVGFPLRVYNVYAWTAAEERPEALAKTEQMFEDIFADIEMQGGPFCILGDFN
eukprot:13790702-Alexandrium_andersonii.AAC.1